MKRNKKILFGALLAVFLMLIMPINPAVDTGDANNVEVVDDETNLFPLSYNLSKYWGNADMKLKEETGFFDTYKDENDTWWFVDPEGYAFYSAGVAVVNPQVDKDYNATIHEKYGNYTNWADATRDRFKEWGINTLGAWGLLEIEYEPGGFSETPYTFKIRGCKGGARTGWETYVLKNRSDGKRIPDVFDSNWWDYMRDNLHYVNGIEERLKDDPYLIGYWLDNEMHWESNPPPFNPNTLLETYLSVPYEFDQPGKNRVVEFLRDRYEDDGIEVFNKVWNMDLNNFNELYNVTKLGRTGCKAQHFRPRIKADIQDFAQLVAHTYFKNITEIVRESDPNHLILGVRFHLLGAPEGVIEECGKYCDVVSINYYRKSLNFYDPLKYLWIKLTGTVPLDKWMQRYYEITNKTTPLIVGEFGCAAGKFPLLQDILEGGVKIVRTQKDRADYFEWYARNCLNTKYVIGYHWFPFPGDWGLVDLSDNPYEELVDRMALINNKAYELHNS